MIPDRPPSSPGGRRHVGFAAGARRERPGSGRAAERRQQFPPSDGDCHTPLPCEARKRNDTTPRACCPTRHLRRAGRTPGTGRLQRSVARPLARPALDSHHTLLLRPEAIATSRSRGHSPTTSSPGCHGIRLPFIYGWRPRFLLPLLDMDTRRRKGNSDRVRLRLAAGN